MLTTQLLNNNSELQREKMWSRIHIMPLLQAEADRDQVRRHLADKAMEVELMGKETQVYESDRWVIILLLLLLFSWVVTDVFTVFFLRYRFVRPTFAVVPEKPLK